MRDRRCGTDETTPNEQKQRRKWGLFRLSHIVEKKKASLYRRRSLVAETSSFRSVSDPPAGPRVRGDCARELPLPIHPTVCFEVGRFALTQSSRPTLTQRCSRKWMSGHAAYALVLSEDRGQFATLKLYPSGEHLPPSRGESPFPVDFYLSWMSPALRHQPFKRAAEPEKSQGTFSFGA
jgi:hypothetical protein